MNAATSHKRLLTDKMVIVRLFYSLYFLFIMNTDHIYTVNLQWLHDRKGVLGSPEIPAGISVATPPDFPKGIPGVWSPEHLFVASASSCLMTTFLAVAENSKLDFSDFSCDATGTVAKEDGKFRVTEILLKPVLTIPVPDHEDKARRILETSERNCLISLSMKTIVRVEPTIVVLATAKDIPDAPTPAEYEP